MHVDHNGTLVRVQLFPLTGRLSLPGAYQLTINSASCSDGGVLPEAVRTRTYWARIWNAGAKVIVELDGADFALGWCPICQETRGHRFTGQPEALAARFTLDEYGPPILGYDGHYPNVVERLPDGTLLTVSGHAVVLPTSEGLSGTLDGLIAIYRTFDLETTTSLPVVSCRSSAHRFTLVR